MSAHGGPHPGERGMTMNLDLILEHQGFRRVATQGFFSTVAKLTGAKFDAGGTKHGVSVLLRDAVATLVPARVIAVVYRRFRS